MTPLFEDTPPHVEELLLAGYRRMSPAAKLERVRQMTRAVQQLALARLRAEGVTDDRELKLRLGSLWLTREQMVSAFGWDPRQP